MDIRSIKYKTKKNILTFVVLLMMFLLSLTMIFRYNYVQLKVKEDKSNPFQSEDYLNNLLRTNYYLYYKNISTQIVGYKTPAEIFLTEDTIKSMIQNIKVDYYSSKMDDRGIKEAFNAAFTDLSGFISDSNGNLKYMCYDTKNHTKIENFSFNNLDKKEMAKKFRNYIIFEYDSKGKPSILYSYGFNKDTVKNYFMDIIANEKMMADYSFINGEVSSNIANYHLEPIRNMKFVYAVPRNVNANFYTSNDVISNYINMGERRSYELISTIAKIVLAVIVIITLIIPTEYLKMFRGIQRFSRFPLELIIAIYIFLYSSLLDRDIPIKIVRETITGDFLKLVIDNGFKLDTAKQIVNSINLIYWMTLFTITFIGITLLKMAFKKGFRKYLVERCMFYRLIKLSAEYIYSIITKILAIDIRKKYERLYIMGIGVIVFSVFSTGMLFEYGSIITIVLFLLFVFSFLIFIKIVRDNIKEGVCDYKKLLDLTKEIANGNLDKDISKEDVGIYKDVQKQLESIQKEYKKSVDEEVKSQKMKSELISNVSHDLKTPLTSILSYTDLLRQVETSEESKMYIDTIYRKSERLKILIDDMFEISKAQTGNIQLCMVDIDIVALAKQAIFEVEDKMNKRGIVVRTSFSESKVILTLDGEKVYRIFENLLVNISKYGLENTRAYVNIEEKDDSVDIVFKNISQTEIDYDVDDIIERFRRGDESRTTEGSGLGLSIAKSYIEAMGGSFKLTLDGDLFKAIVTFPKNEKKCSPN